LEQIVSKHDIGFTHPVHTFMDGAKIPDFPENIAGIVVWYEIILSQL